MPILSHFSYTESNVKIVRKIGRVWIAEALRRWHKTAARAGSIAEFIEKSGIETADHF